MKHRVGRWKKLITAELFRHMISWRLVMVVTGVCLVCVAGCMETIQASLNYPEHNFNSVVLLENMLIFDRYKSVMVAVLAALAGTSYAEDRKNQYLRVLMTRMTVTEFAVSRIVSVVVGVIFATVSGFLLYGILLLPVMSVQGASEYIFAKQFTKLAADNGAWLYLILLGVNFGLATSVLVVAGLWISVWKSDGFVAIGGSVLVFYSLYSFSLLLPNILSFEVISSRLRIPDFLEAGGVIIYHICYLTIWILITGGGFYHALKKRWNNETLI